MKIDIAEYSNKELFYFLTSAFFVFYVLQIPFLTSISDILVYSCRSLSDSPIINYAFLDERSRFGNSPIPNYHLAHTIVLWIAYHIFPDGLAHTIWPSGFVMALCGAFTVGLTFLIWSELGLSRVTAFTIALVSSFIPAIWNMNLIGAPHSFQLVSTLVFLYWFLKDKIVFATVAFLFAALVTPLAGLSFSLFLLSPRNKTTVVKAFACGFFALLMYTVIFLVIGVNVLTPLLSIDPNRLGRSLFWKIYQFGLLLMLNLNFFIYYLIKVAPIAWKQHKTLIIFLTIAIAPQFILFFIDPQFLGGKGVFFLIVFWALSFPIGLGITQFKQRKALIFLCFASTAFISLLFWNLPDKQGATALNVAGLRARSAITEGTKIIGGWKGSIGITLAVYGWDFEKLSSHFLEKANPTTSDLLETGEQSLIIVKAKKDKIRAQLTKLGVPGFIKYEYDPSRSIKVGVVQKIFENDVVVIYKWDKKI